MGVPLNMANIPDLAGLGGDGGQPGGCHTLEYVGPVGVLSFGNSTLCK